LYLLPFDHRHSYLSGLFHLAPPLSSRQREAVIETKEVIYAGFREAVEQGVPPEFAGVLVDEEYGTGILRDAAAKGFITAISTEKSGSEEFEFEFGADFARHIEAFRPTYAKALVRYNPEGDTALNRRQTARLRDLSEYCRRAGQKFMFELLVPPTPTQLLNAGGAPAFDQMIRPSLVVEAIASLQDDGVEPDIWKIKGFDKRQHCVSIADVATRGGRSHAGCIVLGSGEDEARVIRWLETAASVPGFIGFAVGRTTFWSAVNAYVAGLATRDETAACIARRFRGWTAIFRRSQSSHYAADSAA
jgi:myo-inositol catabolism protein IolC